MSCLVVLASGASLRSNGDAATVDATVDTTADIAGQSLEAGAAEPKRCSVEKTNKIRIFQNFKLSNFKIPNYKNAHFKY